ncbi:hypothetical protein D3C72_2452620 [compost metagenome]
MLPATLSEGRVPAGTIAALAFRTPSNEPVRVGSDRYEILPRLTRSMPSRLLATTVGSPFVSG